MADPYHDGLPCSPLLAHELLEIQAEKTPSSTALEFHPDVRLTYQELNETTNRLARYLINYRRKDKDVVAICMEKTHRLVFAVLATLKAGMSWLPLPLDAPPMRLRSILQSCNVGLVLHSKSTGDNVAEVPDCANLDEVLHGSELQSLLGSNLNLSSQNQHDICHILFTSGSTGVPKGVMIEHGAIVHNVLELVKEFELDEETRTFQFAAATFDVFTMDVFMTFASGGCLVIAPLSDVVGGISRFMQKNKVTYAQLTPTVLRLLDPTMLPHLQVLASSGETLSQELADKWRQQVRLINAYGPTETIVCTIQKLSGNTVDAAIIGRAVVGLHIRLLADQSQDEVHEGETGEICVAGPQLFRGYLSTVKGLKAPECHLNGKRYYRTGDLGRQETLSTGEKVFRYLGRIDSQVKLHGVRVDLGDVEHSVLQSSATKHCAVVLPQRGQSAGRLCSIVVLSSTYTTRTTKESTSPSLIDVVPNTAEVTLALEEVKSTATARLPRQIVPSIWWVIKEMPRTASGKVNRLKLRNWLEDMDQKTYIHHVQGLRDKSQQRAESSDDMSMQLLQSIWAEVLCQPIESIDISLSFIDLGADSLDVFRFVESARNAGLDLSFSQVFSTKTIRDLASSRLPTQPYQISREEPTYAPFSLLPWDRALAPILEDIAARCQIRVGAIEDVYPCTPYQSGLMVLDLKCPNSYVCEFSWTLDRNIEIDRFRNAWDQLVATEPVLRNRLVWDTVSGNFWQLTVRHVTVPWSQEHFGSAMSVGHDLCRGLVHRDDGTQSWIFRLKIHHSIIDGWSLRLMLNRLRSSYYGEKIPSTLATSFPHFVRFSIEEIERKKLACKQFWTDYLAGFVSHDFPPTPSDPTHEVHATGRRSLSVGLNVQELALSYQATPATLLHAVTSIVLSAYVDSDDVAIGLILTGRDAPLNGLDQMLGPAFASVPFRTKVDRRMALGQFLQSIESSLLAIIPHQHYGLQHIKGCGIGARNACEFGCLVVIQPEDENLAGKGLWEKVHGQVSGLADSIPLSLELVLGENQVLLNCNYDPASMSHEGVALFLEHVESALCSLSSLTLHSSVSDVHLSDLDNQARASEWAQIAGQPVDLCLHELVQRSTAQFPDKIAIEEQATSRKFSYRQVDVLSTYLSDFLQSHCAVAREVIVPVILEKSAIAIITILAVLKAGGAYVPIDPGWPLERVRHILDGTHAKVILCSPGKAKLYQKFSQKLVEITEEHCRGSTETSLIGDYGISPKSTDLAIVMYTSGSTGVPKGVMLEHRALSTSLTQLAKAFALDPNTRHLPFSSFVYDVSVADIFIPLLSGACICVPTEHNRLDRLSATMKELSIESAILTPSIVDLINPEDAATLKTLMTGGEMTRRSLIQTWAPRVRLINAYGPTEASITSTMTDVLSAQADPTIIGRSITGWHWIVRRDHEGIIYPAPAGCVGEIAIAGHTLARGYLDNLSLTEQCFVQAPQLAFDCIPDRVYLTGDLGCYSGNGQIRIVGRNDRMAKIHGIRVDPGEAESQLRQLEGIFSSAVVQCVYRLEEEVQLVAFVEVEAPKNSQPLEREGVMERKPTSQFRQKCQMAHRRLREMLPRHLIPSLFVPVAYLPYTASSKLDFRRLTNELQQIPDATVFYGVEHGLDEGITGGKSSTPSEIALEAAFREALTFKGIVSVSANFFHQGGDSFTAIKLVSASRKHGFEITVDQVYAHPTLRDLATVAAPVRAMSAQTPSDQIQLAFPVRFPHSLHSEVSRQYNISIDDIEDLYPASHFQQGLAAISYRSDKTLNLDEDSAYYARMTYRIAPKVDVVRLDQALRKVVSQNPIYRTRIVHTSEGIMQLVCRFSHVDKLDHATSTSQFRFEIHRDEQQNATSLQLNIHHILYDAWTISRLLDDVDQFYALPDSPRSPPKPYRYFIEYLSEIDQDEAKRFWINQLQNASLVPFPALPCEGYRARSTHSLQHEINLDLDAIKAANISVATAVAAGYALLLSVYCDTTDVCYGITLSGRDDPDLADVAGPTLSTVPMRIIMDGAQTVRGFLENTQKSIIDMRRNQHYGLQNIARLMDKNASCASQFRTLLVMQQSFKQSGQDQSEIIRECVGKDTSMYTDYPLAVITQADSLTGSMALRMEYDPACLQAVQAKRFMEQLGQAITLCTYPDTIVRDIEILTEADCTDIMAWNPVAPPLSPRFLHHHFEEMVTKQPNSPAIVTSNTADPLHLLSYQQLDNYANRVARYLQTRTTFPSVFGLCFHKSPVMVVVMLAIWKSGGAFVTLDPTAPRSRLCSILTEINASTFVLTERSLTHLFEPQNCIVLDPMLPTLVPEVPFGLEIQNTVRQPQGFDTSDTAYIMYTSGSSGTPKGVVLSHYAIAASLNDISTVMGLSNKTRMLQFAAFTFDTSLMEIFGTLIRGGCLCMLSDTQRLDGGLGTAIQEMSVTQLILTPTVAQFLDPDYCSTVQSLMLIGESPPRHLIEHWAKKRPAARLMNGYGPTEAAVHVSTNLNLSQDDANNVGRATACNVYITKPGDITKLAAIGTIGEIVICGNTLADGYLNKPELTTQAFGRDLPWSRLLGGSNSRFYRTGDIGRYAPDGTIVYLGRRDLQIKIHGQRLELSEIECHIERYERFSGCVMEVISSNLLVAFVTMTSPQQNTPASVLFGERLSTETVKDVSRFLERALPQFMVPNIYIPVSQWPLTVSGKVDRRHLRDSVAGVIEAYRCRTDEPKRRPQTAAQNLLAKVWAAALDISQDQIGIDDTIHALGGDSVAMIRIISAYRKQNINLTIAELYDDNTLEEMAASLDDGQNTKETEIAPLIPFSLIEHFDRDKLIPVLAEMCNVSVKSVLDAYPCTSMQEAMMVASIKTPGVYFNQSVFRLQHGTDLPKLITSLQNVWARHEILRTRIIQDEHYQSIQVVLDECVEVPHEEQSLESYLQKDALMAPTYGDKLSRCALITCDGCVDLVISQHHAVFDGWSAPILLSDIQSEYFSTTTLGSCPKGFASFIESIVKIRQSTEAKQHWLQSFAGLDSQPVSQIKPAMVFEANQKYVLEAKLPLNAISRLATIAESAWGILLGRYTENDDVTFGTVRSGRIALVDGIESILGPTIVTVPRRLRPIRSQLVNEYLQQVNEIIRKALPWEQFGHQNIRKLSDDARRACRFDSIMVVQMPVTNNSDPENRLLIPQAGKDGELVRGDCLTIECQPKEDGQISISATYDDRVITLDNLRWMMYHFSRILSDLASSSDKQIHELDMVGPCGIEQARKWNSHHIIKDNRRIEEIFVERVHRWSTLTAIEANDAQLTYKQLDELSSAMAAQLRSAGVLRGDIVPLYMTKSAAMIVTMLGIFKVGAAYSPLATDTPLERLRLLVEKLQATHIVCTPETQSNLIALPCGLIICDIATSSADGSEHYLTPTQVQPHSLSRNTPYEGLAYVLFTSGSSGQPKGVLIDHSALATTILENGRQMAYAEKTRTLSFAACTFDVNIIEIYLTLLHGGCLFIPSEDRRLDDLSGYIREKRIEMAFLTPTAINNLLREPSQVPSLQTLRAGGEPLTHSILQKWSPHVRLINSYGPTETCVDACRNANITSTTDPSNLGYPIGTHLWVVETATYSRLSPIGCTGELLISGPKLARGYLDDDDRTEQAFIDGSQFPWTLPDETRLYATGDIVRRNADGSISYLGRRDLQTKMNGFRIELGEIESALESCEGIAAAVTEKLILQQVDSEALVAFFTLTDNNLSECQGQILLPSDHIRSLIRDCYAKISTILPSYMMPAMLLPLTKFPLTKSGKADRKSLQQILASCSRDNVLSYKSNPLQRKGIATTFQTVLQSLWARILSLDHNTIGSDSDFIVLGGESIAAIRLAALCQEIGFDIYVGDILRNPVLEDLAAIIQDRCGGSKRDLVSTDLPSAATAHRIPAHEWTAAELSVIAEASSIEKSKIEDVYLCTPLQEALIASTARFPGTYVARELFKIPLNTDLQRFQKAWDLVHESNPILRTRICSVSTKRGVQNLQVVCRQPRENSAETRSMIEFTNSMGLGTPLVRYKMTKTPESLDFEILKHHSVYDGFSDKLIWDDVSYAFRHLKSPPVRPTYRRYVEYLHSLDKTSIAEFWKNYLGGYQGEHFPQLPHAGYSTRANSKSCKIVEKKIQWKAASPFTFATIARAAWALVLSTRSCTSGSTRDICFLSTLSGRTAPVNGIDSMTGPTITTLPVRVYIDLDKPIDQYLQRLQEEAISMLPAEHLGINQISKVSDAARYACQSPNLLVVHPVQSQDQDHSLPLGLKRLDDDKTGFVEPFALIVECTQNPSRGTITLSISNDPSLLSADEIDHLFQQFFDTIAILDRGDVSNSALRTVIWRLANDHDFRRLTEWNHTLQPSRPNCLHSVFEESARRNPESIAIEAHDGTMCYAELDAAANTLASNLQEHHNIQRGDLVPLLFEKSLYMIVAILGVLKAGAGYAPLDIDSPSSRIMHILKETRARVVVVSPLQAASHAIPLPTIKLSSELCHQTVLTTELLPATPGDVAYVTFTSGSTGLPKGVITEHGAACISIAENGKRYGHDRRGCNLRSLQFSAYTFDASVLDIFGTLIYGGCLCIPSEEERKADLEGFLTRMHINFADLTPTIANLLDPLRTPTLRGLAIGGELANRKLIAKWTSDEAPLESFINSYGPTEAGIACAAGEINTNSPIGCVGTPVGASLWVVDETDHNHLVPVPCVGELAISGPTLARGYLNDNERTDAAFIENVPWLAQTCHKRLYKTGDLARFDLNGSVEILGRIGDGQIKLHGMRLELGEIETIIGNCSYITAAQRVAVAKIRLNENDMLAAFLELRAEESTAESSDLILGEPTKGFEHLACKAEDHLRNRLPEYMIPKIWLPITSWPLTSSNKTDRRRLAAACEALNTADVSRFQGSSARVVGDRESTKMTKHECLVGEAWVEVLHLEKERKILPYDDFFRLGGDSLTTIMLVSALRHEELQITAQAVFKSRTLRAMAKMVEKGAKNSTPSQSPSFGSTHCASDVDGTSCTTPDPNEPSIGGSSHEHHSSRLNILNGATSISTTDVGADGAKPELILEKRPLSFVNKFERQLRNWWASVLVRAENSFSAEANFFEIGGDDLAVLRLSDVVQNAKLRLSGVDIYAHAVFSDMVALINGHAQEKLAPAKRNPTPALHSPSDVGPHLLGLNNIENIYPASHTQLAFLIEGQKWCRAFYAWWFLEVDQSSSIQQLRIVCETLTSRYSILRTSFHLVGRRCYQLVMENTCDFEVLYHDGFPGQMCARLSENTRNVVRFGTVLTRFRLLIDSNSGRRILALGLSHAQYDGFSIPTILNDLRQACMGKTFRNFTCIGHDRFVKHTLELCNDDADSFWRELLKGSTPTSIGRNSGRSRPVMDRSVKRVVSLKYPRTSEHSYGAIAKSAWALVLSMLSHTTDIVFGNLVSGRFAGFEGAQEVVGPCINFTPVRIRINLQDRYTDLLSEVHAQQMAIMPYEATPSNRIAKQAPWPAALKYPSIFQYQNLPTDDGSITDSRTENNGRLIGNAIYGGGVLDHSGCWLMVWPENHGRAAFRFTFSADTLSPAVAESILDLLIETINTINKDPEAKISSSPSSIFQEEPSQQTKLPPEQSIHNYDSQSQLQTILPVHTSTLECIKDIWLSVLRRTPDIQSERIDPEILTVNDSFFDLGGDSISAAEVASLCQTAGMSISLQDVIDFPTLCQLTLLSAGHLERPAREPLGLHFNADHDFN